jgi:hypothetical protein
MTIPFGFIHHRAQDWLASGAVVALCTSLLFPQNAPFEPLPEILPSVSNRLPGLLGGPIRWLSSAALVAPRNDSNHFLFSVKDPTVFRYENRWHVYATAYLVNGPIEKVDLDIELSTNREKLTGRRGGWNMVHVTFEDWKDAPRAPLFFMDTVPGFAGYRCAPEAFFFTPKKKWFLVFQSGPPAFSTSDHPDDPSSWSTPKPLLTPGVRMPKLSLDYHLIGDGEHMYLFFTGCNGNFYRTRTTYAEFPEGFGDPVVAMRGTPETVFEASFTYKIKGVDKYLTCVEAQGKKGEARRYFRAHEADRLDGSWSPIDGYDTSASPFAGPSNVGFEPGVTPWSEQVSHGEMVRESPDERMVLDPNDLKFLYQGVPDRDYRGYYPTIPYKLGLLRAVKGTPPKNAAEPAKASGAKPLASEIFPASPFPKRSALPVANVFPEGAALSPSKDFIQAWSKGGFVWGGSHAPNAVTLEKEKDIPFIRHFSANSMDKGAVWSIPDPLPIPPGRKVMVVSLTSRLVIAKRGNQGWHGARAEVSFKDLNLNDMKGGKGELLPEDPTWKESFFRFPVPEGAGQACLKFGFWGALGTMDLAGVQVGFE